MRKPSRWSLLGVLWLFVQPSAVLAQPGPFLAIDLPYAYSICSDTTFDFLDIQVGDVADLGPSNRGCLVSNELNGLWTTFEVESAGRIGFTLSSSVPLTDLDFAVWGPFTEPTSVLTTQPVRCSYAAIAGPTGLGGSATDASEAAAGDGWVSTLPVNAGDQFILYVNNFSLDGANAQFAWEFLEGASLSCLDLPFVSFGIEGNDIPPGGTVNLVSYEEPEVFAYYWELPGSTIGTSIEPDPQAVLYEQPGCYDVTLTLYNAAGQNSSTLTCGVNVLLPTAVDDVSIGNTVTYDGRGVVVHPPGTDGYTVSIVDLLGRTLVERTAEGRTYIEMEEWPLDMVLISVRQGATRQVHRLVLR